MLNFKIPSSILSISLLCILPGLCLGCAIRGSGVIEEKEYEVEEFSKIVLSDGFDGFIYSGDTFSVRSNTDDNLTEKVSFEQSGDTITIRLKEDVSTRKATLEATFIVPIIEEISLKGRSTISAQELSASQQLLLELEGNSTATLSLPSGESIDQVDVISKGNSRVDLNLNITTLNLSSSDGSSNSLQGTSDFSYFQLDSNSSLSARSFTSKDAEVAFSSGSAGTISATNTITGSLSGNSSLTLSGGAAVDVEKSSNSNINTN